MVSPQDGYSVFVFYFEEQDVEECFDGVKPAVNIVAHKKVVGGLGKGRGTGSLPQISKISRRSKN